jgi:hypothetical protein
MKKLDIDSHDDPYPLGKPLRPAPAAKPDEYEKFTGRHGDTFWRNKRTGAIETRNPGWPYEHIPYIAPPGFPTYEEMLDHLEQMGAPDA